MSLYLPLRAPAEESHTMKQKRLSGTSSEEKQTIPCLYHPDLDGGLGCDALGGEPFRGSGEDGGCCPHCEARHAEFQHITKTAMFAFILLVILP